MILFLYRPYKLGFLFRSGRKHAQHNISDSFSLQTSRLYATKFMRVLLRAKTPYFSNWGMELLTNQVRHKLTYVENSFQIFGTIFCFSKTFPQMSGEFLKGVFASNAILRTTLLPKEVRGLCLEHPGLYGIYKLAISQNYSSKLRVFDKRKAVIIPCFGEKSVSVCRKYGVFLGFRHT